MLEAPHSRRAALMGAAFALAGPGIIALLSDRLATRPETIPPRAFPLILFISLMAALAGIALRVERLRLSDLGFARVGWSTPVFAAALTTFFVFVFGPVAYWALDRLGWTSFDVGIASLAQLPAWYLAPAVAIVAAGEEWLYRGYAIERLAPLAGSRAAAGAISLLAFVIVHLPMWGPAVALTTAISGAVLTLLYLWRRDVLMLMLAHAATDLWGLVVHPTIAAAAG